MIRLKKLYSEPAVFDPIHFESGINIILGEKSDISNKTNGVGKTIAVEFLNFCLLKKYSESRVSLIPTTILASDTKIHLDFDIAQNHITVSRKVESPDSVTIFKNNTEIFFDRLDEASEFLSNLYFESFPAYINRISFRNLLAPIIRDERSEFKNIIKCFDTDKRIPPDYKPHLFFLGLSVDLYSEIKDIINELDKKTTYLSEIRRLLTDNDENKIADAKAKLNELEREVYRINASIEQLRSNESFEIIQKDIIALEAELSKLRTKQKAIRYEINQINSLPQPENISENEIVLLFNQFKDGLGSMVKKSLKELKLFRDKIDGFRNTLVNNKLNKLKIDLAEVNEKIRKSDEQYSEKISLLDNGELFQDLKTSINVFNKKNQELNNLRALIAGYDKAEKEQKSLLSNKNNKINEFDELLNDNETIINSFEQTILDIHENIIGNKKAHFEIKTVNKGKTKEFLSFDLRTDDDGSSGTERLKVFIYDMALLFNDYTKIYHPGFLVHDNIFNIDNDSLEKSLNYLYKQDQNRPEEFQYILTLNRDMVEIMEERKLLKFNIENYKRATYTKDNRFLKKKYNEIKKKK